MLIWLVYLLSLLAKIAPIYSPKQLTFKVKLLLLFIVRMDFAPSVQHHRRLRTYVRPITVNPLIKGVKK
jgi:hypothetical protein